MAHSPKAGAYRIPATQHSAIPTSKAMRLPLRSATRPAQKRPSSANAEASPINRPVTKVDAPRCSCRYTGSIGMTAPNPSIPTNAAPTTCQNRDPIVPIYRMPSAILWATSVLDMFYRAADALRRRSYPGDLGRIGEDLAHRHLRKHGCTVVARNYRTQSGAGEIDLVVWHGKTLVFVEVKSRTAIDHGDPASAVDVEKRTRLRHAARDYARRANVDWNATRFDIVSVVNGDPPKIEWLPNAFR